MRFRAETALTGVLLAGCATLASGARSEPPDTRTLEQVGLASWYGDELRGRRTASGERFDPDGITAAHRTLPMPSYVEVTALDTGRTVLVRINDRGPFHGKRIIDLSAGAARQLGIIGHGQRHVRVRRVYPSDGEKVALRRADRVPALASITIPPGDGPFYIQVGSFSSRTRAASMAGRLGGHVTQAGSIFRVRMGPYENTRDANAALVPLAAKGYSDVIITR